MHGRKRNDDAVFLSNLHLLFWLSLLPFVTGWMGENHFQTVPVAAYGVVLLMCAIAYSILARSLVSHHGENAALAEAIGTDRRAGCRSRCTCWALACR